MTKAFARTLRRKKVMSSDGKVIGQLKNIIIDVGSGQVINLIVRPDAGFDTSHYKLDDDCMLIPFEAVKDIKDYIVVDRYMLR